VEVQPLFGRYYKSSGISGFATPGHYRLVTSVGSQPPATTELVAAVGYELKPLRYVQKTKGNELEE